MGAVPANTWPIPGAGNVIVYMFSPKQPGTYMYHCHQEADIHVQMGMYGALVIYNLRQGRSAAPTQRRPGHRQAATCGAGTTTRTTCCC